MQFWTRSRCSRCVESRRRRRAPILRHLSLQQQPPSSSSRRTVATDCRRRTATYRRPATQWPWLSSGLAPAGRPKLLKTFTLFLKDFTQSLTPGWLGRTNVACFKILSIKAANLHFDWVQFCLQVSNPCSVQQWAARWGKQPDEQTLRNPWGDPTASKQVRLNLRGGLTLPRTCLACPTLPPFICPAWPHGCVSKTNPILFLSSSYNAFPHPLNSPRDVQPSSSPGEPLSTQTDNV